MLREQSLASIVKVEGQETPEWERSYRLGRGEKNHF
jgi:hypothetical protein